MSYALTLNEPVPGQISFDELFGSPAPADEHSGSLARVLKTMSPNFTRSRIREAAAKPEQLPGYLRNWWGTGGHTEPDCLVDYSPAGLRIRWDDGGQIEEYTWTRVSREILGMIRKGEW